jgi:hypothetical protein
MYQKLLNKFMTCVPGLKLGTTRYYGVGGFPAITWDARGYNCPAWAIYDFLKEAPLNESYISRTGPTLEKRPNGWSIRWRYIPVTDENRAAVFQSIDWLPNWKGK